ncbi:GIY-YIG nuclease family protein [Olivibacter sp. CPCC 100613]|uniref:GIY-YIG nuclease family protein n=1 Tax=Olivibacter sp. CPCC 100613 TaxID=3079931 RepID=UPI002FFACDB2
MKRFVYILTDCNRQCLHVGLTDDLAKTMAFYREHKQLFFDATAKVSRLVYFEEMDTEDLGVNRFKLLSTFTRSQKERLIRAVNKDWQDLSSRLNMDDFVICSQPAAHFFSQRVW